MVPSPSLGMSTQEERVFGVMGFRPWCRDCGGRGEIVASSRHSSFGSGEENRKQSKSTPFTATILPVASFNNFSFMCFPVPL